MAMTGRAHGNARCKIHEAIVVDVPDFRPASVTHDKRVVTDVTRRDDLPIALDERAGLRAGQTVAFVNVVHRAVLQVIQQASAIARVDIEAGSKTSRWPCRCCPNPSIRQRLDSRAMRRW